MYNKHAKQVKEFFWTIRAQENDSTRHYLSSDITLISTEHQI